MENEKKVLMAKCPHCQKKFNFYASEDRPFCSDQCKTIDMGSWLREDYSIAGRDNSVYIETSKPSYVTHVTGFGCEEGQAILPPLGCAGSEQISFSRSNDLFLRPGWSRVFI